MDITPLLDEWTVRIRMIKAAISDRIRAVLDSLAE